MRALPLFCLLALRAAAQAPACPDQGPNLILNPGFEQGYYGFTSDFGRGVNNATRCGCATQGWVLVTQTEPHGSPSCQLYPPEWSAQYGGPNTNTPPDPSHPSNSSVVTLATCNNPLPDHGTGSGFFLTIDPDACPQRVFWRQTLDICPRTWYRFAVWVRNVSGLPAPLLHFEADGVPVTMPSAFPEREWVEHSALWYSDDTDGQIALELVNDLPGCIENDVAIDDLFFGICGSVRLSSAAPPPPFCPGDASAEIALRGRAEGLAQPQYQWQHLQTGGWQDLPGATDTLLRLLAPTAQDTGLYRLAAAEWGNLGSRTCALYSPPIRLQALPSYHFRDTATICQGEIYLGLQNPGTYTRRYQTSLGCDSLHTLELRVRGGIALYLPNAFSPDDDGHNDTLQPEFSALDLDGFHWQVFDRWGNLLFESRDPAQAWDGHARGRRCETGVYLSTLRFEVRGCQNAVLHQDVLLWGN